MRQGTLTFKESILVPGTQPPNCYFVSDSPDDYIYSNKAMQYFSQAESYNRDVVIKKNGAVVALGWNSGPRISAQTKNGSYAFLDMVPVYGVGYSSVCTDGTYIWVLGTSGVIKFDFRFNVIATGTASMLWSRIYPDTQVINGVIYGCMNAQYTTILYRLSDDMNTWIEIGRSYTPTLNCAGAWTVINGLLIMSRVQTSPTQFLQLRYINFSGITPAQVTLSSVVSAELLKSNLLQSGDIDVTALTSTLRGYKVTAGSTLRNSLELLQGAWPFDLVQKGYKLVAKKRGGASVVTVPATDLAAAKAGA